MKSMIWLHLLLFIILSILRTTDASVISTTNNLLMRNMPCYICAAERKLQSNGRKVIFDQAKLAEDHDKCEITIIREIEDILKTMEPESWQNTAIDGFMLKRDTEELLSENQNLLSVMHFRKKLDILNLRWKKYWIQQDFNKWTALRHWLRLPALRHRLQIVEKDLKSGKPSQRLWRLLHRIQRVQNILQTVKSKLQDTYAILHREGKSLYSETILQKRFIAAIDHKLAESRRQYFSSKHNLLPSCRKNAWKCYHLE